MRMMLLTIASSCWDQLCARQCSCVCFILSNLHSSLMRQLLIWFLFLQLGNDSTEKLTNINQDHICLSTLGVFFSFAVLQFPVNFFFYPCKTRSLDPCLSLLNLGLLWFARVLEYIIGQNIKMYFTCTIIYKQGTVGLLMTFVLNAVVVRIFIFSFSWW